LPLHRLSPTYTALGRLVPVGFIPVAGFGVLPVAGFGVLPVAPWS
jgi:hypothetical protein